MKWCFIFRVGLFIQSVFLLKTDWIRRYFSSDSNFVPKLRSALLNNNNNNNIMTNGRASYTFILCHELIPENRSSWMWTILLFNLIFGISGALPWRMRSSPLVARSSCGITERSPLTADWRSAFYTFTAEPHLTVPFVQTDPGRRREPGSCEVTSHL